MDALLKNGFSDIRCYHSDICDRIWEKGPFYELQTWHEYIVQSSYYTCCKSWVLPTSGVSGASAFENRRSMPHFGGSLLRTRGLLRLLTLDLWSRRSKLLINQARSLGLLRPWNSEFGKWPKIVFSAKWSLFSDPVTNTYPLSKCEIRLAFPNSAQTRY